MNSRASALKSETLQSVGKTLAIWIRMYKVPDKVENVRDLVEVCENIVIQSEDWGNEFESFGVEDCRVNQKHYSRSGRS